MGPHHGACLHDPDLNHIHNNRLSGKVAQEVRVHGDAVGRCEVVQGRGAWRKGWPGREKWVCGVGGDRGSSPCMVRE